MKPDVKSQVLYSRLIRVSGFTTVIALLLLSFAIVAPIYNIVDTAEATVGTATASTLTYTSTNSTASVNLTVNSPDGTFATSTDGTNGTIDQRAKFSISTNNYTGYTLTLKSTGTTTTLNNTSSNTTIATIPATTTYATFSADTDAGKLLNNKWGYIPSYYYDTTNETNVANSDKYFPASTTARTLMITDGANSTPDSYTIGLGLRADFTNPAGTYTNDTFILEIAAKPIVYAIYFRDNSGGTVSGLPEDLASDTTNTNVSLPSTTPTRADYAFKSWCLGTVSNSGTTCTGMEYSADSSFGIDQTTNNTNITLYAVWTPLPVITINAGAGVSSLAATGWTNTGTASISKTYTQGTTIDLSTITPTYKTAYSGVNYAVTSGSGSISGSTYTVGAGDGTITLKATALNTPTCTMQGGATKVYNRSATTLTATDNAGDYDTESVDITYSFGYATSGTADLGNFAAAQTGNTLSIAKAAYRGARYYGVTVVVTDKTDSTITNTCTSGTGTSTGTTVANRTTMTLVNSRINFNATTNGGTLSGTSPVYVYYGGTATYSSRTGKTARAIPTATKSGYTFTGWWTAASGGSKVINADGTLTGTAVSGWTNASSKWVKTGTSNSATATANQLYAQFEVSCTTYMQNLTSSTIATLLPSTGSTATVCDSRDNQQYTIAKLADDKYWMVSNLNLAGGTALDADKTDVDSSYISSFTTSNNLTKTGSTIVLPAPSTSGFSSDNYAYVYNSGSTTCGNNSPCYSYYSWDAATLGSGRSISTDNTNAPYSICPKGWKLPTTYDGSGTAAEATDFRKLMIALGGSNSVQTYNPLTSPTGATMYGKLTASPYNFLLAGRYTSGSFYLGGGYGYYWSATSYSSSTDARSLFFDSSSVYSADYYARRRGFSVRCVFDPGLANTTWTLNSTLDIPSSATYYVDFTSDGTSFNYISMTAPTRAGQPCSGGTGTLYYGKDLVYCDNSWGGIYGSTINITGGTDATNAVFIDWLKANAVRQ